MTTTTDHQIKNPTILRIVQYAWIVAVFLNFIIFSIGIVDSYQSASNGSVFFDILVDLVPNSAYIVWEQYEADDYDELYWRVTEVSDVAARAGLQVGDLMRIHWGQGLENMSIPIRVLSEGEVERQITLVADELGDGYIVTSVSPDAEAAGIQIGDMMYGDYIIWEGEIGSEITFQVIHEGATEPESVTMIRKPNLYVIKTLTDLGFSVTGAALLDAALVALAILISFAMAILIFTHRSDNWMALLFAWLLSLIPVFVANYDYISILHNGIEWNIFEITTQPIAVLCVLIFPTGRIYPRWSLLLIPALIAINFGLFNFPGSYALIVTTLVFILIQRYQKHFSQIQQQQSKWVVYAFSLMLITQFTFIPTTYLESVSSFQLAAISFLILERLLETALIIVGMIFIAFAILRYRLYDIDVVINRSLVGAIVTIVLLLIFVPSVFLIQAILGAENTVVSFIVSAAIPALVFNPTRKRVRQFIDRRIYGFRFDLNELGHAQRARTIVNPGALTGQKLGNYEVRGLIGKGGMGEVYQAFGEGHVVAIKTMLPEVAKDTDLRTRFEREAEAGKILEHPNIARVYGSGIYSDTPYMVMEYIEGRDLSEIIKEEGGLDEETSVTIVQQICSALDAAHKQGYVHRDIKPSNIMIQTENAKPVLMGFGVTKSVDATSALTGTGAIGTIDYMAPEQIMSAKTVDHRADIYALGIVAFELLTGEKPFKGSAAQVMFAHIQQPPPYARDINPDIPEHIADAIEKAMQKDPDERFESAEAFAKKL